MIKVRLKHDCSVFVNCVRYEYKEGWEEVDEKHLKELRKLGAVSSEKPQLEIEVKDFRELERLLEKVDKHYNDIYSAVISFDPPGIYLDNKI